MARSKRKRALSARIFNPENESSLLPSAPPDPQWKTRAPRAHFSVFVSDKRTLRARIFCHHVATIVDYPEAARVAPTSSMHWSVSKFQVALMCHFVESMVHSARSGSTSQSLRRICDPVPQALHLQPCPLLAQTATKLLHLRLALPSASLLSRLTWHQGRYRETPYPQAPCDRYRTWGSPRVGPPRRSTTAVWRSRRSRGHLYLINAFNGAPSMLRGTPVVDSSSGSDGATGGMVLSFRDLWDT